MAFFSDPLNKIRKFFAVEAKPDALAQTLTTDLLQEGKGTQGDPFDEEQTSRIETLRWEIGTHPARGLTPQRLASILEEAQQGNILAQCDLFQDMEERDAHLFAELSKRRRSLLGLDWSLVAPRDATAAETKAAVELEALLRDQLDMETIIWELTDAIGKGFAALEIEWQKQAQGFGIKCLHPRPQRWFILPPFARNDLRLRDPAQPYGAALWPLGWVVHRHAAKSGWLPEQALFRVLAWPYLFKHYSVRDLAEFLEIYGLPLRLGKYPVGSSPQEKATLLRAVLNIGHAAGGIIPQGMEIDFQKASDGHADPYKLMMEWTEASISKAIVGQTLTAQSGHRGEGSRALGEVHDKVRWDITVSDARQLQPTLTNQLVLPIGLLNGLITNPERAPRFAFNVSETEDLESYAKALPALVGINMKIPATWAHEKLGIPIAEEGEDVLHGAQTPPPMIPAPLKALPYGTGFAHAPLVTQPATVMRTPEDELGQQLVQSTAPIMQQWLEKVEDILNAASSLDEAKAMLFDAFNDLPSDALTQQLAQALLAAHAAGRYDVEQQSG